MITQNPTSNRSRWTAIALGLTLIGGAATPVLAGPIRHAHPSATPANAEIAQGQQSLIDDRHDLLQLSRSINDWHRAIATGSRGMELSADLQIQSWLYNEMMENRAEAMAAQRELAGSRAQTRHAAHQAGANSAQHQSAALSKNDDKADAKQKMRDAKHSRQLYDELLRMQASFQNATASGTLYQRKRAIYRDLQSNALAEIGEDREELMEDSVAMGNVAPAPPSRRPTR